MSQSIEIGHVSSPIHGRYLIRESEAEGAAPLLVAFHGYGEDAEEMLEAAVEIPGVSRWHIASIQALNRFYRTRSGEVGASWMTKQDRELAIGDNVEYVLRALTAVRERLNVRSPTVFVGFSQGAAMAYRAAGAAPEGCQGLVALAGDVPPELARCADWNRPSILIGRGSEDEWYNEGKWEQDCRLLESLGSAVETCVFDGAHEWTDAFRHRAGEFLERVASA